MEKSLATHSHAHAFTPGKRRKTLRCNEITVARPGLHNARYRTRGAQMPRNLLISPPVKSVRPPPPAAPCEEVWRFFLPTKDADLAPTEGALVPS